MGENGDGIIHGLFFLPNEMIYIHTYSETKESSNLYL